MVLRQFLQSGRPCTALAQEASHDAVGDIWTLAHPLCTDDLLPDRT